MKEVVPSCTCHCRWILNAWVIGLLDHA
jgi:hypothetical protein